MRKLNILFGIGLMCAAGLAHAEESVTGTINWGKKLSQAQRQLSSQAVLYVFAKKQGAMKGTPPMAVKRFTQPIQFPISFSLSGQDAMVPGIKFEGPMTITARISQSGGVIPVNPGDIEGIARSVNVGKKNLRIKLDDVK